MQFGPLTLKQCRYGWMLFLGLHIGKCFELYGEYSESEVIAMRCFVRPGDTVLDIGANIGDLTLPLSKMVGPNGCVHAIESNADTFNILCANLALNQISNVQPINAYVKESETPFPGQVAKINADYKVTRIDDLNLKQCRLIKIDVDGHELDVLKSGTATIKRLRPVLYLENDVPDKSEELLKYLLELDYNLYWHVAPIFSPNNFLSNPVNHWEPDVIASLMVLGIPKEQNLKIDTLQQIHTPQDRVSTHRIPVG